MATKAGRYDENLLQIAGSGTNVVALVGASVEVFNSDGVTNATLYDDRDKTAYSGTGSVVEPDSAGNLQFFADPGIYVLEISVDGTLARTDTVNVSVDGVEAADFPSLASNETVTGAWTFSTDPTLADGSSALSQTEGSAAYVSKAGDTMTGALLLPDGTAAAPAASFAADPDTGILRNGANILAFAAGGLRVGQAGADYWYFAQQLRAEDGTAAAPAFSFNLDQDTGIFSPGPDNIGFACGGTRRMSLSIAALYPRPDNAIGLGRSTERWTEVWAVDGTINTSDVNEKTDVTPITGSAALDRVIRTAAQAIQFRWADGGTRTHAGFDAQGVGTEHGSDSAAYIDPSVEANARTNPYAAAEPTAEWYADYDDPAEAEAEWVEARDEFDAETQAMLASPKGLRPGELIPDLYAAIAAQQQTITDLVARIEALETHHA